MRLALIILLTFACGAHAAHHIFLGAAPGDWNVGISQLSAGSNPTGILTFHHDCEAGPCTMTLIAGLGGPGVTMNGCWLRPPQEQDACVWPANANSGVVFRHQGEVVGYVEFRCDGELQHTEFYTSGGLAFGHEWEGVTAEWICKGEGTWADVRTAAGVDTSLSLWQPSEGVQ